MARAVGLAGEDDVGAEQARQQRARARVVGARARPVGELHFRRRRGGAGGGFIKESRAAQKKRREALRAGGPAGRRFAHGPAAVAGDAGRADGEARMLGSVHGLHRVAVQRPDAGDHAGKVPAKSATASASSTGLSRGTW